MKRNAKAVELAEYVLWADGKGMLVMSFHFDRKKRECSLETMNSIKKVRR